MKIFPINASLARLLIPGFLKIGITANQITGLSLIAGIAGAVSLLKGTPEAMVMGAFWFLAANLLDECDGAVARATGASSGWGSWFDTLVGCAVHALFFASLGLGVTRQSSEPIWALLGVLSALGVLLATAAFILAQGIFRGKEGWEHPDPPRTADQTRLERIKAGLRTDFSMLVFVASLMGALRWLLWGGLVGAFLFWIPADLLMAARLRRRQAAGR